MVWYYRQKQYLALRDTIRSLFQQLEMSARTTYEADLFLSDPNTVTLSDSDMSRIKVNCILPIPKK